MAREIHGGDGGMTSLGKNKNISKADERIEAVGALEELLYGLSVYLNDSADGEDRAVLEESLDVAGRIISGIGASYQQEFRVKENEITLLDQKISERKERVPEFERQDGEPRRVVSKAKELCLLCRKAERRLAASDRKYSGDRLAKAYLNRLAEYLDYIVLCEQIEAKSEAVRGWSDQVEEVNRAAAGGLQEIIIQEVLKKLHKPCGPAVMDLDTAKRLLEALEKRCAELGMKAVFAVCRPDGNMVAVHAMDDAYLASFEIAMRKAYTAVAVKMSTMELAKLAEPGQTFYGIENQDQGRLIIIGGGVVLTDQGEIIGGLGVSGGTGEEDHAVALYGQEIFTKI